MNKVEIALRKLSALPLKVRDHKNQTLAMSFHGNVIALGYVFSQDLFNAVCSLPDDAMERVSEEVISALRKLVGADVKYRPMYPNFPKQVIEASDEELLFNALTHYWTFGTWSPQYTEVARTFKFEPAKLRTIDLCTGEQFQSILTKILSSADSISPLDKEIVAWFNKNEPKFDDLVPAVIPYKENLCLVAALRLEDGLPIDAMVKTGTDVMRVYAHISGGDLSLTDKVKFKSLPKAKRRVLTNALAKVLNDEDLKRRPSEWVRMAHQLHVGDFSPIVWDRINKVRENQRMKELESFNGDVDRLINDGELNKAAYKLCARPGEFVRRISELVDKSGVDLVFCSNLNMLFAGIVDRVPTRILCQVWGYLKTRVNDQSDMFVMSKGNSAVVVPKAKYKWSDSVTTMFTKTLTDSLLRRFGNKDHLGKVWVDPALNGCLLPTQMRSASTSLKMLARGSRVPFAAEGQDTLRFFIYWKGNDIDLSASFHDDTFKLNEHVSYTRLRSNNKFYHSGDITRAPNGAAEFIDIDIPSALAAGHRYVVMNVYVYNGPSFAEHEVCYAGWMSRKHPNSNEIFDPKTVEQCSTLASKSRSAIPVIFDLQSREAIWVDIATKERGWGGASYWGETGKLVSWRSGNNVEAHRASIMENIKFFVERNNKISLFDLFSLHAEARGEMVSDPSKADFKFGFIGDITPFDVMSINSDFMAD